MRPSNTSCVQYLRCVRDVARRLAEHCPDDFANVTHAPYMLDRNITTERPHLFDPSHNEHVSTSHCPQMSSNVCGLTGFISDHDLFSGVSAVVLVGDSTILRAFKFIVNASDWDYFERVNELKSARSYYVGESQQSRRSVPVYFLRSLYVSTAPAVWDSAFKILTSGGLLLPGNESSSANVTWFDGSNRQKPFFHADGRDGRPLIISSYGPWDTAWLVFHEPMPYFSKKGLGVWRAGRSYWSKFMPFAVNAVGAALTERFPNVSTRPVIIFREQFKPDCRHPKYAKNKAAKCVDLLAPQVVPLFRMTLSAALARINIPVVSMDYLLDHGYCAMLDAGHLKRRCKWLELQLIVQAFHLTVSHGIVQGMEAARLHDDRSRHLLHDTMLTTFQTVNNITASYLQAMYVSGPPFENTSIAASCPGGIGVNIAAAFSAQLENLTIADSNASRMLDQSDDSGLVAPPISTTEFVPSVSHVMPSDRTSPLGGEIQPGVAVGRLVLIESTNNHHEHVHGPSGMFQTREGQKFVTLTCVLTLLAICLWRFAQRPPQA